MKMIIALTACFCLLYGQDTYHENQIPETLPHETVVLQLPFQKSWKLLARSISADDGLVEYIPVNQTAKNWSELIALQYVSRSTMKQKASVCIQSLLGCLRDQMLSSSPGNKVIWNTIEKNKADAIYEWSIPKTHNNEPPEHEIARIFLTDWGMCRVGFTRKGQNMTHEEREQYIKLLRESSSVIALENLPQKPVGLTVLDTLRDSLNLDEVFNGWKIASYIATGNESNLGFSSTIYVPPFFSEGPEVESLEIGTAPNIYNLSLAQWFNVAMEADQKSLGTKLEFQILKPPGNEVVYYYVYPDSSLQITAVVRSFLTDHGYHTLVFKRRTHARPSDEEIKSWAKKLETVKICD